MFDIITGVTWILVGLSVVLGAFAFLDAVSRRADVFPAADKRTKGLWVAITGGSALVFLFGALQPFGPFGPPDLFWIAAVIGSLVYVVDVRPTLKEIQGGGSRGW